MWRKIFGAFGPNWQTMRFQPILYFMMWGATLRMLFENEYEQIHFEVLSNSPAFYSMFITIGIFGPILALAAYFMITRLAGKLSYLGMWFMLAADISQFTNLLAVHLASVFYTQACCHYTEAKLYSRYVVAAALVFILILVFMDLVMITKTGIFARKIRKGLLDVR